MDRNKEIEFLMFTVKQTKDSIFDVAVDMLAREYTIVQTDLYGQTINPETGGKLRRKAVEDFAETLSKLDLVSLPVNEKNTLPIDLDNATLMYVIKGENYFTDGSQEHDLSALHKELEQLIGTTFGSYDFYK